jgi:hypothetical protein
MTILYKPTMEIKILKGEAVRDRHYFIVGSGWRMLKRGSTCFTRGDIPWIFKKAEAYILLI